MNDVEGKLVDEIDRHKQTRAALVKLLDRVELYLSYSGNVGTKEALAKAMEEARKVVPK